MLSIYVLALALSPPSTLHQIPFSLWQKLEELFLQQATHTSEIQLTSRGPTALQSLNRGAPKIDKETASEPNLISHLLQKLVFKILKLLQHTNSTSNLPEPCHLLIWGAPRVKSLRKIREWCVKPPNSC